MKTYDPKKFILNVGGIPIGGYADGTFINLARNEDAYTTHVGADGEVARAKSNNKTAALTITLAQTSDSNDVLSALANLDERANAGVVPAILKEIGGNTTAFSGTCWVRKMAPIERGKEIANTEWILDMAESNIFVGGNQGVF